MQNAKKTMVGLDNISLNNDPLLFEFEELVLKHFKELSEDIADAIFIADITRNQLIRLPQLAEIKLKEIDNLSEEIDYIFSKHKFKIIEEVCQSVASYATYNEAIDKEQI